MRDCPARSRHRGGKSVRVDERIGRVLSVNRPALTGTNGVQHQRQPDGCEQRRIQSPRAPPHEGHKIEPRRRALRGELSGGAQVNDEAGEDEEKQDCFMAISEAGKEIHQNFAERGIILRMQPVTFVQSFPQQPARVAHHHVECGQPAPAVQKLQARVGRISRRRPEARGRAVSGLGGFTVWPAA